MAAAIPMNKLTVFALALTVTSCQAPLRSAEARAYYHQCGKYHIGSAWNKKDRFLYYRAGDDWTDLQPVSRKEAADLAKGYYRGHKCELMPFEFNPFKEDEK
jgi:hypothetical protein